MFVFSRSRSGSTEVFDILVPPSALPDAESRFGEPIMYCLGWPEVRHCVLGVLVMIHDDDEVEFFLGCKGQLSESELKTLYREIELMAGHGIREGGAEPEIGWFEHDTLVR